MSNEARIERALSPPSSSSKPFPLHTETDNLYSAEHATTATESSPPAANDNVEYDRDEVIDSDIEIIMDDAGATVQSHKLTLEDNIAEETNKEQPYNPPPPSPPQTLKLEDKITEETNREEQPYNPPPPSPPQTLKLEDKIAEETNREEISPPTPPQILRLENDAAEEAKNAEKPPPTPQQILKIENHTADKAKREEMPPPTPPQVLNIENDAAAETKKQERPPKASPITRRPTGISKKSHRLPVPKVKREDSKIPMPRAIPKAKAPLPSRLLQTLQQPGSMVSKSEKTQAIKESIIRTAKVTIPEQKRVKEPIIRTGKAANAQPKVVQTTKQKTADRSNPPSKVEVPPPPPPPPTMSDLHFSNQLHVKPIEHSVKPSPLPRENAFISEGTLTRENAMIWEGPLLPLSPPTTSPIPPVRRNIFSDLPPLSNVPSENVGNRTGNKRTRALLTDRKLATPPPPPARNLRKRPSPNIANKENAPSVLRRTDSTKDVVKAEITTTDVSTIPSTSTVPIASKKSSLKRPAPTDDVQEQLTAKELMLTTRRNTARNREYYSAIRKIVVHKNEKRPPSPSAKIKKKMGKGQATRQALGNRKLGTMVPSTEDQQMHDSDASNDEGRADEPTDGPPRKRVKWSKDVILNTPEKKQISENLLEPPKSLMKRHRIPILDQYGNASNAAASLSPLLGRKQTVTVTKHVYIDDPVGA